MIVIDPKYRKLYPDDFKILTRRFSHLFDQKDE